MQNNPKNADELVDLIIKELEVGWEDIGGGYYIKCVRYKRYSNSNGCNATRQDYNSSLHDSYEDGIVDVEGFKQ